MFQPPAHVNRNNLTVRRTQAAKLLCLILLNKLFKEGQSIIKQLEAVYPLVSEIFGSVGFAAMGEEEVAIYTTKVC